jgi:hypothetical protein
MKREFRPKISEAIIGESRGLMATMVKVSYEFFVVVTDGTFDLV